MKYADIPDSEFLREVEPDEPDHTFLLALLWERIARTETKTDRVLGEERALGVRYAWTDASSQSRGASPPAAGPPSDQHRRRSRIVHAVSVDPSDEGNSRPVMWDG